MSDDRKYPASLVHNDEMYVLGGYNDAAGWLDSVDVKPSGQCEFQQKEEWKMLRGMYNFCAVSHEDKIYTVGISQTDIFHAITLFYIIIVFIFAAFKLMSNA